MKRSYVMTSLQVSLLCHVYIHILYMYIPIGRAIAQAVSRRFPTSAARFLSQVWSCEIFGGQSGIGIGFLRVLRFPLPILIPPTAPHSSSYIIWGWLSRPNNGRSTGLVSPHPKKLIYIYIGFFNLPNPSSRTMALGSTQPPTESSTRNLYRGKGRPACKADNLTAICEPVV
jgi:hypothetical protein